MIRLIFVMIFIIFTGCGSDAREETSSQEIIKSTINKTSSNVKHEMTTDVEQTKDMTLETETNTTTVTNISQVQDPTFSTIKSMIAASLNGTLNDVTYIELGDSTRAYTYFEGVVNHSENILKDINATLSQYNVDCYLVSEGGLALKTFLGGHYEHDDREWISYMEVIDKIPGDGNTTIINLSMISNDFSRLNEFYRKDYNLSADNIVEIYKEDIYPRIKADLRVLLKETIFKLREYKPNVKIMLTSPNPFRQWEGGSKIYQEVYEEIAKELNLPFANLVKERMPSRNDVEKFNSWYNDDIHFSWDVGMKEVVEFVLDKILP